MKSDIPMSILHELWYDNIIPQEHCHIGKQETKELLCHIANHHENLVKSLSDKQKELFEKYQTCWDEYISITEADIFEYAFRLGAQLAFEILKAKDNE